jgi:hypothetical protein
MPGSKDALRRRNNIILNTNNAYFNISKRNKQFAGNEGCSRRYGHFETPQLHAAAEKKKPHFT